MLEEPTLAGPWSLLLEEATLVIVVGRNYKGLFATVHFFATGAPLVCHEQLVFQ